MKLKSEREVAQSFLTLCNSMDCEPTRLLHPWDFPGKNTGVGCHRLLQDREMQKRLLTFMKFFVHVLYMLLMVQDTLPQNVAHDIEYFKLKEFEKMAGAGGLL